jgi:hypothetical protein
VTGLSGRRWTRLAAALAQIHNPIHGDLVPRLAGTRKPLDLDAVHLGRFTEPEVDSGIVGRQVTSVTSDPALHGSAILPKQLDHASVSGTIGVNSLHMNQDPMPAFGHRVQKQARWTVVVGDQNIHAAVVIHVAKNGGSASSRTFRRELLATPVT